MDVGFRIQDEHFLSNSELRAVDKEMQDTNNLSFKPCVSIYI